MRRMIPDPEKLIKCSLKNVGRQSRIYVPFKNLDDLPVRFDLIIISGPAVITPIIAYYSKTDEQVYGGGTFTITNDGKGSIDVLTDPDSLINPEMPYLELDLNYLRGDIQTAPLMDEAPVFVTNVIHLEKGVIDIA